MVDKAGGIKPLLRRKGSVNMASEAQRKATAKYDKENTVQFRMKLNLKTDKDILDRLASVPNKQGYIKALIREDMAKDTSK